MELKKICGSMGFFFGRLNFPSELTIAYLGDNDDLVTALARTLDDIGKENLTVSFRLNPDSMVSIVIEDKRDPTNFLDIRTRTIPEVARFMKEFTEIGKFVITVGDLNLNMAYNRVRFEMDFIDWKTGYIN